MRVNNSDASGFESPPEIVGWPVLALQIDHEVLNSLTNKLPLEKKQLVDCRKPVMPLASHCTDFRLLQANPYFTHLTDRAHQVSIQLLWLC